MAIEMESKVTANDFAADSSRKASRASRLFIKEMVMRNFKSYAGEQRVGPFHKTVARPPTCPADNASGCDSDSGEWEVEFFPGIPKIKYEGPTSKNDLSFKWYTADEEILGKKMKHCILAYISWDRG